MSVLRTESSENAESGIFKLHSKDELLGDLFEWLYNLTNLFDRKSREIEIATGFGRNHALAIKVISRSPSISVSALAKRMQVNTVTMVRVLDRLEKQGLVKRIRSLKDRRVVELRITEQANEIELILGNMTCDILKSCLAATDGGELQNIVAPLKDYMSHFETK